VFSNRLCSIIMFLYVELMVEKFNSPSGIQRTFPHSCFHLAAILPFWLSGTVWTNVCGIADKKIMNDYDR